MIVSFGSVALLVVVLTAPGTFLADAESPTEVAITTLEAVSVGAIFSVVGAATADSVF